MAGGRTMGLGSKPLGGVRKLHAARVPQTERMAKKAITLFKLAFKGSPVAKILALTTARGETVIKPLGQPSIHLSVYTSEDNEIRRHVADETFRGKRRFTHKVAVRPEQIILL